MFAVQASSEYTEKAARRAMIWRFDSFEAAALALAPADTV